MRVNIRVNVMARRGRGVTHCGQGKAMNPGLVFWIVLVDEGGSPVCPCPLHMYVIKGTYLWLDEGGSPVCPCYICM